MCKDSNVNPPDFEAQIRDLLTAYPEATVADGPYGGFDLTVLDPARPDMKMIFQTDGSRVMAFRSGLAEFVDWIEGCS